MNLDQLKYRFNKIFFDMVSQKEKDDDGWTTFKASDYAIAGGCLRDSLVGEKIKDIDIFCKSEEAVKNLEMFFAAQEGVKILNGNSVLSNYKLNGYWFQIIRDKFYNLETLDLIENFDFTMCGIMMHNDEIRVLPTFFEDLATRRLRVNKLIYPLSSLERMQKYIKKGYSACNGTLLELAKGIQTVNLDNPDEDTLRFYPDGSPRFFGVD